jgi:hypothetical protein
VSVNRSDQEDQRFYAAFANEDPGRSPIPLISMIGSLEASDATDRLGLLRAELLEAMVVEDYLMWTFERLLQSTRAKTQKQITGKGVRYRAPKKALSFQELV